MMYHVKIPNILVMDELILTIKIVYLFLIL